MRACKRSAQLLEAGRHRGVAQANFRPGCRKSRMDAAAARRAKRGLREGALMGPGPGGGGPAKQMAEGANPAKRSMKMRILMELYWRVTKAKENFAVAARRLRVAGHCLTKAAFLTASRVNCWAYASGAFACQFLCAF